MKKYIVVLLLLTTAISTAQSDKGTTNMADGVELSRNTLKGHAYLLNDWVPGFAVDLNGNLSEQKLLNYNTHENKLTFKLETGSDNIMVVNTASYSGFILKDQSNDKTYMFTKLEPAAFAKPKKETKFYEIISAPTKEVIQETIKHLKDPTNSGWSASRNTTKRAEFVQRTNLYVLNKEGKYVKVSLSKGSVLKAFKDQKAALQNYINSEKISFKKPADLVAVVQYYHTL